MIIDGQHYGLNRDTSYTSVPFEAVRKVAYGEKAKVIAVHELDFPEGRVTKEFRTDGSTRLKAARRFELISEKPLSPRDAAENQLIPKLYDRHPEEPFLKATDISTGFTEDDLLCWVTVKYTEDTSMESHDFLAKLGLLHREETGRPIIRGVLRRFGGPEAASQFDDTVDNAKAAGGNWLQILLMILPLVLSLFGGGGNIQTIIQQIIAAISGLFPQPRPVPTPGK